MSDLGTVKTLEIKLPEQPYGPGAICEDKKCKGHFALRHGPEGCDVSDLIEKGIRSEPCGCQGFMWQGNRWYKPWLSFNEGGMDKEGNDGTSTASTSSPPGAP